VIKERILFVGEKTIDEKDVVIETLLESMKTHLRERRETGCYNVFLLIIMMLEKYWYRTKPIQ
jgi:hypothetical protein